MVLEMGTRKKLGRRKMESRITRLRRHYWNEITRMKSEIKTMENKLSLLDEMEKLDK